MVASAIICLTSHPVKAGRPQSDGDLRGEEAPPLPNAGRWLLGTFA